MPSGSLEEGEDPREAVLREAYEETGLSELEFVSLLGDLDYTFQPPDAEPIRIKRYFYHLSCPHPPQKSRWRHWENNPSEGDEDRILFELYWVDYADGVPDLVGELGAMVDKLVERDD